MIPSANHKTVIPNEASRRIFFRVRSSERVGLRREESLFDVSLCSTRNSCFFARFFSLLCALCVLRALCVNVPSGFFLNTYYSLLTLQFLP